MKAIIAQGNPGKQYQNTRHNIGFTVLDAFALENDVSFTTKTKFNAEIAEFSHEGEKILLVKPTTFYNETGRAARAIADFYKLAASDILAVHDELSLPFGVIRTRLKGRDAGNNGIKSLNAHLGQNYARIRIGVNSERSTSDTDFVLSTFTAKEQKKIPEIIGVAIQCITKFVSQSFEPTKYTIEN